MNSNSTRFLVIDDNAESRYLVGRTLLQSFPHAILYECQHSWPALEVAAKDPLTAVIVHRATDSPGVELIREMRKYSAGVPIIMVSGRDRRADALAAGADMFVAFEEWPRIPALLENLSGRTTVATAHPFKTQASNA